MLCGVCVFERLEEVLLLVSDVLQVAPLSRNSMVRHVRPSAWSNSDPTERRFVKFDIFRNYIEKFQVSLIVEQVRNAFYVTKRFPPKILFLR